MGAIAGLDIGGTKIEGILRQRGRVLRAAKIRTPHTRKAFLESLGKLIKSLAGESQITGIGIAIAGAIDLRNGIVKRSPHLKFINDFPICGYLHKKFKIPVAIDNDTKCFLLAEREFGTARGKKNVVALTLGTGVGGAVLVNGQMLRGSHVTAVELGHIFICESKEKFLSLEDLVSSHGFKRLGIANPLACQKQAMRGDKDAIQIYQQVGEYLGVGLANLVNIFDPELIILGGGISKAWRLFLPQTIAVMKEYSLQSLPKIPPVKVSKLPHAGALGAAALFLSK